MSKLIIREACMWTNLCLLHIPSLLLHYDCPINNWLLGPLVSFHPTRKADMDRVDYYADSQGHQFLLFCLRIPLCPILLDTLRSMAGPPDFVGGPSITPTRPQDSLPISDYGLIFMHTYLIDREWVQEYRAITGYVHPIIHHQLNCPLSRYQCP